MRRLTAALAAAGLVLAACSGSTSEAIDPGDGGVYTFDLGPADFVARIDNPYLPLVPGARWVLEGGGERTVIEVLTETRTVMGIEATVVHDAVYEGADLAEDTYDWFAQDTEGNVWYLGEESVEYDDGEPVSTAGSWEAGVDGALPGIVMQADPFVGQAYRQEYYQGEAEDLAEIARIGETVTVPFGEFTEVLVISEWNPLEPRVIEEKFYAPGVGILKELTVRGGSGSAVLIEYVPGG